MKIYMDVCCFCRPFDEITSDKVYLEGETVLAIIQHANLNNWDIASSDIIDAELLRLKDSEKLSKVLQLYENASKRVVLTKQVEQQAKVFQNQGIQLFDSLHLALAEIYKYDILLTTDIDFIRIANKINLHVKVKNPVIWFMEVK